ncbi:MAG: ATP-binding protein [Puniceicoccales bacterium]|jgi:predicted AAA+ superfamily ATPase|nr:ATP-binding protein [Puniceicoccales bacterium]
MIKRDIQKRIEARLGGKRAVLLIGARQVGKTSLLKEMFSGKPGVLWLNGDDPDTAAVFDAAGGTRLRALIGNNHTLVIDEAQRVRDIGLKLKIIIDQVVDVQLVATGSSAFDLANRTAESLAGRKWTFHLHALSFAELVAHHGLLEEQRLRPHRLVFGAYPEVVTTPGDEAALLRKIADSALYKDVLSFGGIKNPDAVRKLLKVLAWQIGSQVSYQELGQTCGLSYQTVEKYIDILEKAYVVFRLGSYSRNLRNELKKSRKVYFCDTGIRNAVIGDFRPLENRPDAGALWENYLVAERQKRLSNEGQVAEGFFWRTQQKQEIDYIEEANSALAAFEIKWNPAAKTRGQRTFLSAYPTATHTVVTSENYAEFLLKPPENDTV